jgi:hypothetical protein
MEYAFGGAEIKVLEEFKDDGGTPLKYIEKSLQVKICDK